MFFVMINLMYGLKAKIYLVKWYGAIIKSYKIILETIHFKRFG